MLKTWGIEAGRCEHTGVWVGESKIAALGVQISRGLTSHGFALNCNTDLNWYSHIVPCGILDKGVTSIKATAAHNGTFRGELKTPALTEPPFPQ